MNNYKIIIFFLISILLSSCSFDNKTGIWGDSEKEKRKIAELEKKQKQIIEVEKIYSSETIYLKEKLMKKDIILSKPKKNNERLLSHLNYENFLGNLYLTGVDNVILKKKIGKNKFNIRTDNIPLLAYKSNFIFSDDTGTIFNINKKGKINWKKNIYKKIYKRINKILVLSIYKNNIYIADNIGFIYSIDSLSGKLLWIKNYGTPIKSNIKIFKDKIFLIDHKNKIICLNSDDGSLVWDVLSIESFIKSQNLLSLAVSKEGNLFAVTSSADIYKIRAKTGDIFWSRNTAESLYANATDFFRSSEIVIADNNIIFSSASTVFLFDIKTGNTVWKKELSSIAAPIVDNENIFIVTKNGYFVILNKEKGKIISSTNILKILKKKNQKTLITGFVLGSDKIYAMTQNGFLIVSSASSGKVESFKKIGKSNMSPLIINEGALYYLTENSKIFGFK